MDLAYANGPFIPGAEDYAPRWSHGRPCSAGCWGIARRSAWPMVPATGTASTFSCRGRAARRRGLRAWRLLDGLRTRKLVASGRRRAEPALAVAIPSYTLAPQARIGAITREIAMALGAIGHMWRVPIVVTGHSAGGHLSARMACRDVALPPGIAERLVRAVPISPLADLGPLRQTKMNETLKLDAAEAKAESPITPTSGARLRRVCLGRRAGAALVPVAGADPVRGMGLRLDGRGGEAPFRRDRRPGRSAQHAGLDPGRRPLAGRGAFHPDERMGPPLANPSGGAAASRTRPCGKRRWPCDCRHRPRPPGAPSGPRRPRQAAARCPARGRPDRRKAPR